MENRPSKLDAGIAAARAICDYLLISPDEVTVDLAKESVQRWLTNYGAAVNDNPSEALLTGFSALCTENKFHDLIWLVLLAFLAQNSALTSQDAPPRLVCLSSVLANASTAQLRALHCVYHHAAFLNPVLSWAPIIPGHLKLPYLLVLA
jgi:hypothetical protein